MTVTQRAARAMHALATSPAGRSHGPEGVPRVPDDYAPSAEEAWRRPEAARGRPPFHAHEVLEARWKTGPAEERELWQGLAQICVGLTPVQRGNLSGAAALLTRGSARLGAYGSTGPTGWTCGPAVEADAVATAIDGGRRAGSAIADPGPSDPRRLGGRPRPADPAGVRVDRCVGHVAEPRHRPGGALGLAVAPCRCCSRGPPRACHRPPRPRPGLHRVCTGSAPARHPSRSPGCPPGRGRCCPRWRRATSAAVRAYPVSAWSVAAAKITPTPGPWGSAAAPPELPGWTLPRMA